jgi:arginase family enzyme
MGIERIKKYIKAVPDGYRQMRSHDENDHWLVQEMLFEDFEYRETTHVLIGCPQHEGVQRNNGRIGAAEAPNKIREQLYKLQVKAGTPFKLFDAGNILTDFYDFTDDTVTSVAETKHDALDQIHDALTKVVSEFLRDGKQVIVLGGGNDISYADIRALSEAESNISAINIDAH